MAERKLNLNAPLMSVRRYASPTRDNAKMMLQSKRKPSEPDFTSEEAIAVPFHWEQIPGRAKSMPCPGNNRALSSISSLVEREGLEEDDVYSDALETLSSKDTVSFNCSATSLSGLESAAIVQPCGTFSTDPHTRDFMMKRFLPAAKAMAFEPPPRNYATKKQGVPSQDQPRQLSPRPVPRLAVHNQHGYHQNQDHKEEEEEEIEEEVDDSNEPKIISATGCGLFPRLCFGNSLTLIDPLPGLKLSSPKPMPTAYKQSLSKSVKKAWDNYKKKSESGSFSSEVKMVENRKINESKWRTFSGELKGRLSPFRNSRSSDVDSTPKHKKPDIRSRSGELGMVENKGRTSESKRFTYSGELCRGRLSPFRSTRSGEIGSISKNQKIDVRSQMVEKKRTGESRHLTFSGDLQRVTPCPLRNTRAASISPYRNQSSESPFRRAAFVSVPKVEYANNRHNLFRKGSSKASTNQGSYSTSPAFEKTVYVDTVCNADSRYSRSGYMGNKPRFYSGEQFVRPKLVEEATEDFSFQDIKCVDNALALEILEQEILMSVDDNKSSLFSVGLKQQVQSLDCSEKLSVDQKEDLSDVNSSLVQSPLPPPLPRSPSESWLWRTIPSISMRNSLGSKGQSKTTDPNKSSTGSTKWETIVKTSKSHHDHVRYSEELVAHISKQSKT